MYAVGLDERGQGIGHSRQDCLVAVLFLCLYLLPGLKHLARCAGLDIAIHVRMAEDEFVAELVAYVCHVKRAFLFAYL